MTATERAQQERTLGQALTAGSVAAEPQTRDGAWADLTAELAQLSNPGLLQLYLAAGTLQDCIVTELGRRS